MRTGRANARIDTEATGSYVVTDKYGGVKQKGVLGQRESEEKVDGIHREHSDSSPDADGDIDRL